jgi:uncharacterized protein
VSGTIKKLPVLDAELEPMEIPAADVVSGTPEAAWAMLWRNDEGTLFNGVWHCTPGVFYLDHADETVTLLEGRATVSAIGFEPVELRAGDTGFIPAGRVRWEIHETVRKSFHNYDATGALLGGAPAAA